MNHTTIVDEKKAIQREWLFLYVPFVIPICFFICCLVIEIGHVKIPLERRGQIYSNIGSCIFVISILLNVFYGRMYGIKFFRSLICVVIAFELYGFISQGWCRLDEYLFGGGSLAMFRSAIFIPLISIPLSKIAKLDYRNTWDYLTPYLFFHHGTVTHGCWMSGCCAGKAMSWGVFNPRKEYFAFPTQPYIILLSVGIALYGLTSGRKNRYQSGGRIFADSLILYGVFRFIMEFFSDDLRIIGALSVYSICSAIMVAMGYLINYYIYKKENNQTERRKQNDEN